MNLRGIGIEVIDEYLSVLVGHALLACVLY